MATHQAQQSRYSESDFRRVEEELAQWHQLTQSVGWKSLMAMSDGVLYGWRTALVTMDSKDIARTQGMIAGAHAFLNCPQSKILELENVLASMRMTNESYEENVNDVE